MTHYAISRIGTTVAEVTVKDGVVTPVKAIMGFDVDLLDVSRLFGSVDAAARAALRVLEQNQGAGSFTITRLSLEHLAGAVADQPVVKRSGRHGRR